MADIKLSTISKKGQTTVPLEIRKRLELKDGDHIIFEVSSSGEVLLKKALSFKNMDYLKAVEQTLTEWTGHEDDDL